MRLYDCYGQHTLEQLQDQLERYADVALYEDVFSTAGLEPGAISSWEDFRSLPLTTTE